uniref:Uncharacterized protein n=1 Tax=Ficedula albicollis TaxID=59894 RepID=U3KGV9_FICAL
MAQSVYLMILLLCLRLVCPLATGIFMEKLTSQKLCTDDDCVSKVEEYYNASDSIFINIKKGHVRVDSCLYEDHMGTVDYFPSSLSSEQHVYQEANKTLSTRDFGNTIAFCE